MSDRRQGIPGSNTNARLGRRTMLRAAALMVVGSALAACTSTTPSEPAAPGSGSAVKPGEAPASKAGATPAAASTPASKAQQKISFATDWNSGVRKDTIDIALKEFQTRNPDIPVEALHLGSGVGTSNVGGFSEQIVAMFISGQAPDLVFSWIEIVGSYRNFLTDLTPVLMARNYQELGIVEVPTYTHAEGKQYGINFAPATGGWLYNITMFEQAGVDLPTDQWTWDDAVSAFVKLTNPAEKRYGFWSYNYSEYGYLPLVMSNGGSFFTDETLKTVNLCDAKGTQAFEWWVDLIYKHKVSPEPGVAAGMQTAESSDLFALGLVAVAASGLQSVGNAARFIGDRFKWGIMHYPLAPQTNDRRYLLHTEPLVVPKDAEKRDTVESAVDLALFLAGDDFVQNYIAENRPTIPVKQSVLTSPAYVKGPPEHMDLIGKQLQDSQRHYQTRPLTKWWAEFTQKLTAATDKAFIGEATAKAAWEEACQACQKVVDSASN